MALCPLTLARGKLGCAQPETTAMISYKPTCVVLHRNGHPARTPGRQTKPWSLRDN